MTLCKPLPAERLHAHFPPARIPWNSSAEIPRNGQRRPAQPRALQALELALQIKNNGYNVYLSGETDLGRTYMLRNFLAPRAKKEATPHDLLYVNNFDDMDKPLLIRVPAGQGQQIKSALSKTLQQIKKELPSRLEAHAYVKKRGELLDKFQNVRSRLLREMDEVAGGQGFNLDVDDQGSLTLYPLIEGKRLSEEEFEKLDTRLRQSLKRKGDALLQAMTGLVRKLSQAEKNFKSDEKALEREVVGSVLDRYFTPMVEKACRSADLAAAENAVPDNSVPDNSESDSSEPDSSEPKSAAPKAAALKSAALKTNGLKTSVLKTSILKSPVHSETGIANAATNGTAPSALQCCFDRMRADILENIDTFLPRDHQVPALTAEPWAQPALETDLYRYDINLFVDNSKTRGAPIIVDDHPTFANLLGCVERESEMGALVTDFTLIKAGSLHRANGGYLVLHMEDVLSYHNAWEGLVRALRSGLARIEDAGDAQETSRIKGIEPEALPLEIKVILVGPEDIYETLILNDERFPKLFKIKAQLNGQTERNAAGVRAWLYNMARITDEANLLPFDRDALAGLVDFSSLLCEDHRKLSLKFPLVREVMIEASALTSSRALAIVDRKCLNDALESRLYRANLVEELFMEEYDRDLIKVRTSGQDIGRVNGLSVTWHSDFEFGLPHQISCTVGVGHGGIIDLEREAELGGPIHTKAMMILKSYLVDQFAHNKPLVLTGSLCFEQSYAGIEGDSASGAELVALLSALSNVPVHLSLAFTGAVSQSGHIMAVGGVTRKIEGFFELCTRRGLTGEQGVILPYDNAEHLLLNQKVLDAVQANKFSIYPVSHISEALELLTGIPTGKRRKDGSFPMGSLFEKVDSRLFDLGWLAEHSFKQKRKKRMK